VPLLPIMLRDAANAAQRDDIEFLDISEIVARKLAPKTESSTPQTSILPS